MALDTKLSSRNMFGFSILDQQYQMASNGRDDELDDALVLDMDASLDDAHGGNKFGLIDKLIKYNITDTDRTSDIDV